MKTILFQGDSITDCSRYRKATDDKQSSRVIFSDGRLFKKVTALGEGYPAMVSTELEKQHKGEYRFYNRGVGGDRIPDVYARIVKDIINLKPDYMSLLVGVNDVWHGFDFGKNGTVSITKYEKVVNGSSQNATYKTTHITAGFKNLPYVTVSYNSELVGFDQKPIIENGRTLVPLRAIFEKIGATVEWNGDTQTVTAIKDDVSISLTIDNTTAYKNGQTITLDVPAKIINGRTLVPVRFVADCFGVDVQWNGDIQRVILTK